jgi:hypothetical protein
MLTTTLAFSWIEPLLAIARDKKRLETADLPRMNHHTRSKDLMESWLEKRHPKPLWAEVLLEHRITLIIQWSLTLVQAFGNVAPTFVTYKILQLLERRTPGEAVGSEAWIWVLTLTLTTIAASWTEAWLYWISWSAIAIPIRAQLSTLIFQKAMRRKDVKGASSKSAKKSPTEAETPTDTLADAAVTDKPEVVEEDTDPKGKQSTVNLIGVDAKRVSDFCSFNNYFPGCVFKLTVSFTFLISIIGWKSLLAGFAAMSLSLPINIYFSKRYSSATERLMKVRDVKTAVVTEALQGIE